MLVVYTVQTKPIGWELLLIQRGSRVTGSLWEEPWAEGGGVEMEGLLLNNSGLKGKLLGLTITHSGICTYTNTRSYTHTHNAGKNRKTYLNRLSQQNSL